MSSGSAQDVAVERFLRDIERRGKKLHCTVIGREGSGPHGDMNLLYRKSRLDWRHRDADGNKKSSSPKDASATVGKVRDLASFRRHFRMGFLTMPASQDLSPRPCASAMAPRSQSCHSVGTGSDDGGLENGDFPGPRPPSADRRPPAKPKRHPSTRLSSPADPRGVGAPKDAPPPLPAASQLPGQHLDKRSAMSKSDSGDMLGRKVPPLKPKRSPNTQLSFEPPPPRAPPPPAPLSRPAQERAGPAEDTGEEEDEPVYIEMVGQVFSRESRAVTPHPAPGPTPPAGATTPDSDSDQSEAIYEEMKYPLAEESDPHAHLPHRHERLRHHKTAHPKAAPCASSPLPHPPSHAKPKAAVSISHSSPLPSSTSSTPVPTPLSSSPQPPRAPTPFLLPANKTQTDTSNKIPAPFPNLLQHRPPLLAFPQPAAASSGVGAQLKAGSSKGAPTQVTCSMTPPLSTSSSSKLPVLQLGPKDSSGGGERQADKKEALLGPAPGLRARSHSTPLPPSSQSSSHHYSHHHSHRPPSHYHHYRRPDKELPTSHSMKLGSQSSTQTQTPVQGGSKDAKGVSFLLKSEKRDRERDTGTPASTGSQATPSAKVSLSSAPSPSFVSSSTQRSSSRPLLQHPHSAHPLYHALPAYRPPPSDSPLLWTYPSAALRRPPAYDSLRGGATDGCAQPALQGKSGSLSRDGGVSGGGATTDEGAYWPMQRKMSFSHSNRETEKEDGQPGSGTADSRARLDREDRATLSGIPVRSGGGGVVASGASESTGGTGRGPEPRALAKSGLPLPCQTFPACHRNGELGRLGRSSSTSGVRHGNSNMQRQGSLPPREGLSQLQTQLQAAPPSTPPLSHQQQQLQLHQQLRLQLQYQHLAQLAQCQPPTTGGSGTPPTQGQRDGKLLEVIERKRCLCKEIKAHRRPDRNLCKQDSMPILPSWRRTPEPRKTGTPPCQPPAVLWDTSI
ncbi:neuronal tyrosine-phosphorylated phosphoinositide-3-kinase adapter 1 [Paramormyrops kingsleyae]|uniref:neuronal tyrosine-phosphorylated phosphoinositide-3-kinase adapter 1 n=1 Tax=Paramormyrops kingsleyae TaxID=1676925 RepID=UPI000CD63246|nr:neuronal tyrosine-phosphorylated phosphoinositide-3-kinase adapter 1-like isoform X1 [Paramormyrops kingsleyae]XP_023700592.1 neuronal tyrosine-phosphorylated phosphoinositide-3-kinase adapter 1-like isoform X1 [Paramormyrops kingsleyae]